MPSRPPPSRAVPVLRFSTEEFPERERLAAWREIVGRAIVNIDIEPLNPNGFHCEATVCQLPGLGVVFPSSVAMHMIHSRELIADDDLSFMAAPTCQWAVSQLGRTPTLGPGEGILMTNGEVGSITLGAQSRFTSFRIPRAVIAARVSDLDAAIARPIPADNVALKLLVNYLGSARDMQALVNPELQQLAVTHVYDLLAMAIGPTRDAEDIANGRGLRAARAQQILAEIRAGFADPAFSPRKVATKTHLSVRYLQDLLQETGSSFTARVTELRLQKARAMLASPRHNRLKVSEIAYACGFNEVSHFNRSFRARFGASPTAYRGREGAEE
jgi:AraC-like DNA-binding protein